MTSFPSSLPDWVIIDRYVFYDSFPTGEPSEASCTNSRGDEVSVCFQLREPPRPSRLYLSWPGGKGEFDRFFVISAHRDAVLLQMIYPIPVHGREFADLYDYFLYTAGDGDGSRRRPSLERFPSVDGTMADFQSLFSAGIFVYTRQRLRRLDGLDMGVLRRGRVDDSDSALAELQIDRFAAVQVALHVLCPSSSGRWQVRHPKINFRDSDLDLETLVFNWYTDIVVAVGSYLCWVDYCIGGILLCDVFDTSSRLRYIPFPDKLPNLDRALHGRSVAELYQGVSVNEDHGLIKFAMVVQGDGQMIDERFTPASGSKLTSWTMDITDEANMSWTIDSVLHSDDLWKLDDDFARLLRIPLEYPVVSMANPSSMCFVLREEKRREETGYRYDDTWLVDIDMANETVMSSCQYINGKEENRYFEPFISSELPKYLKLYGTASEHNQGQGDSDFEMSFGSLVRKKEIWR